MLPTSPYISAEEAGQRAGLSRSAINRLCDRGAIPAVTGPGGVRRIPRAAFDAMYPPKVMPGPAELLHTLAEVRHALKRMRPKKAIIEAQAALDRAESIVRREPVL